MSIATPPRSSELVPILERLRGAARTTVALRAAGILSVLLSALVATTMLTDWLFRFDPVQRRILAVLGWGSVLYFAYRFLWRPLSADLRDESLALLVEKHHPALGDRLISALQFDRHLRAGIPVGSPVFVEAVTRQAAEAMGQVDFRRCLDPEPRRAAGQRLGATGVAVLVLAIAIPGTAWRTWLDRIVLLGAAEWPRRSEIAVEDHRDYMARGDTYTLTVHADVGRPRIPEYVVVHYRFDSGAEWSKLEVPRKMETDEGGKPTSATYRTDEPFRRLMQPVEYWVEGGDDRAPRSGEERPTYRIELTDRPQIENLVFEANYPEYSRGGQEVFPIEAEDLELVHGTKLVLRMETNKELEWGRVDVSGAEAPRAIDFARVGNRRYEATLPIDDTWPERAECEIHLLGVEGLREAEPKAFRIHAHPDAPPRSDIQVKWLRTMVTADAILPLWLELEDDFAIQDAWIAYRRYSAAGATVDDKEQAVERILVGRADFGGRSIGPMVLDDEDAWALKHLGLEVGGRLEFQLESSDFRPQTGASQVVKLQIVDASTLIKELNTRQQNLRQELERVLDKERETKYATLDRMNVFADKKAFTAEDLEQFAALERRQRSFVAKVQFVAEQFEEIRLQMKYNQLYEEDIYNGLIRDEVVKPLQYLSTGPLLATAHKFGDYAAGALPGDVADDLLKIAGTLDEIVEILSQVLSRVVRLEKFGEIIVRVKQIYEEERKLLEDAKKIYVDSISDDIFEEEKPGEKK